MDRDTSDKITELVKVANYEPEPMDDENDIRLPNVVDYAYNLPSGTDLRYHKYSPKVVNDAKEQLDILYKTAPIKDKIDIAKEAGFGAFKRFDMEHPIASITLSLSLTGAVIGGSVLGIVYYFMS